MNTSLSKYPCHANIASITSNEAIMKTTLDLPEELLDEAMKVTGTETKSGVIILALKELIRKSNITDLKKYRGKIDLDIDLENLLATRSLHSELTEEDREWLNAEPVGKEIW